MITNKLYLNLLCGGWKMSVKQLILKGSKHVHFYLRVVERRRIFLDGCLHKSLSEHSVIAVVERISYS